MISLIPRSPPGLTVALVIGGSAVASPAQGQVQGSSHGVSHACFSNKTGSIRVVNPGTKCSLGSTAVHSGVFGPRGPWGATGAKGAIGLPGLRGATGPQR